MSNAAITASQAPSPAPLALSSGAIESAKWLALALMILDHANKYLFAESLPAAFQLGRLSMPLFAFVLAYNLARPSVVAGATGKGIIRRLALAGLAATPAYVFLGKLSWGWWPLNVMAMLLVATIVLRLVEQGGTARRAIAAIVFLLAGAIVEYWWFGLACVGTAWRFCKAPTWQNGALVALATASLGLVNGNQWALAAIPVAALLTRFQPKTPRSGRFFYWFFPLHLFAIAAIACIPIYSTF